MNTPNNSSALSPGLRFPGPLKSALRTLHLEALPWVEGLFEANLTGLLLRRFHFLLCYSLFAPVQFPQFTFFCRILASLML